MRRLPAALTSAALTVPLAMIMTLSGAQAAPSVAGGEKEAAMVTGTRSHGTGGHGHSLEARYAVLVPVAAFTANGDLPRLERSLHRALDAGVTVNEVKEVLVQMYAYAGFPRSLNGVGRFMTVMEQRREQGIVDEEGPLPSPLPTDRTSVELGTENQTRLVGAPATGGYIAFTPALDQFLKGHLFGDIFGRDNLDWHSREVATIAALATMPGLDPQLESHFRASLNIGLTPAQLRGVVAVLGKEVGKRQAEHADRILDRVLAGQ
jgi:4-carboxymuconolactone decarboxylase